jgi:zinc/manganese transport system substrate-binding protein
MPAFKPLAGLGLLCVAALAGCDGNADSAAQPGAAVEVVASTNVWADIASEVGGEHVHVTSFLSSPSQDPHSYEASGRNILAVSKADVVIENGGGYDDFMDNLLDSAGGDPTVLNIVDLSGLDTGSSGGELNEHVWYDLAVARKAAGAIADAFADADPAHRGLYEANADAFGARVEKLIGQEARSRANLSGRPVAITEPVPGYMLDALGLVNATPPQFSEAVEEGEDVPVAVLKQTLDLFADDAVDALVYNEQTTGTITEQVLQAAQDAGISVVPVTETLPDGEDYVSWMASNLTHIEDAVS